MKQVKVSLPDFATNHLSEFADRERRSLSEEIRERITQSVQRDFLAPETLGLLDSVTALVALVEKQTGHPWYSHPAAIIILQDAIVARLERCRGGVKEAAFMLDELPTDRIVGSADQRMWGAALEAVDVHTAEQERVHATGRQQRERKVREAWMGEMMNREADLRARLKEMQEGENKDAT